MENSCIGFEGSKRFGESKRNVVESVTESTTDSSLSSSSCGAGSSSGRSVSSLSSPPTKSQLLGWPLGQGSWRKSSGKKMMVKKTPTKVDTFGFKRIGTETSGFVKSKTNQSLCFVKTTEFWHLCVLLLSVVCRSWVVEREDGEAAARWRHVRIWRRSLSCFSHLKRYYQSLRYFFNF